MLYSATKRTEIVERLLDINLSAKKELSDILHLATSICGVPSGQINLLDTEKQYTQFWINSASVNIDIENAFCKYTISSDDILEVPDTFLDNRFSEHPAVQGAPHLRFYAGAPLTTQSGIRLGSLCVMDTKPGVLNALQKTSLEILAKQIITHLEFELSLVFLKEERNKVIEIETKLKSIFLTSPASHIVVDKSFRITAFNKAAHNIMNLVRNKSLQQGAHFLSYIEDNHESFVTNLKKALAGFCIVSEQRFMVDTIGETYWEIMFSPVYDGDGQITGVSVDSVNITEAKKQQQQIANQNEALRKIAHIQSHEVRRPLANIISFTELLRDKNQDDFDELISYLKSEAFSLDNKIRNIVELSNSVRSSFF